MTATRKLRNQALRVTVVGGGAPAERSLRSPRKTIAPCCQHIDAPWPPTIDVAAAEAEAVSVPATDAELEKWADVSKILQERMRTASESEKWSEVTMMLQERVRASGESADVAPSLKSCLLAAPSPPDSKPKTRSVRFDMAAHTLHEITPYDEIYGLHPRSFDFDRSFGIVPAKKFHLSDLFNESEEGDDCNDFECDSDEEWVEWVPPHLLREESGDEDTAKSA